MNQKSFTLEFFALLCFWIFTTPLFSAEYPPDCIVDLPSGMAEDTIYLGTLPNGTVGDYYDNDIREMVNQKYSNDFKLFHYAMK